LGDVAKLPAWVDMFHMICEPYEDYIWRVSFEKNGAIDVRYIGYCPIDTPRREVYRTFESLPEWMKDRLAVLNMMPPDPLSSVVFGVGRRIDETTWWVVEPGRARLSGTDTRG
jgi:hypothetical protein